MKKKGQPQASDSGRVDPDNDRTKVHTRGDSPEEDSCRCKEVSAKTVPDLFKLMISDLAFWKKKARK